MGGCITRTGSSFYFEEQLIDIHVILSEKLVRIIRFKSGSPEPGTIHLTKSLGGTCTSITFG